MNLASGYRLEEAVPLDQLKPHPKNPNQGDVGAIADSIDTVGFYGVVTAQLPRNGRKTGRILAGEHRWHAARGDGASTIPVNWLDVDDETALRILLGDNQIARLALFDLAAQASALEQLAATERGLAGTGTDTDDLDQLLRELTANGGRGDGAKDKTDPDAPEMTALGDFWVLGAHRLICADAFDKSALDQLTEGVTVGCVLTDPPYGIDLDTDYRQMGAGVSAAVPDGYIATKYRRVDGDSEPFDAAPLRAYFSATREQFWFGGDYYHRTLCPSDLDGSFLVWDKRDGQTGNADGFAGSGFELIWSAQPHKRDLLRHFWFGMFGDLEARDRFHPTQKPTRLLAEILTRWSPESLAVADPFGGSGSTLIACEDVGRTCLMAELDPRYCDVIVKRWADYTGQTPELNGQSHPIP